MGGARLDRTQPSGSRARLTVRSGLINVVFGRETGVNQKRGPAILCRSSGIRVAIGAESRQNWSMIVLPRRGNLWVVLGERLEATMATIIAYSYLKATIGSILDARSAGR